MPAPIALIVYRRPHHLARVIRALEENPEARDTVLYVFSDSQKNAAAAEDVAAVRGIVQGISGFREVRAVYREANNGLARNLTSGVSHVLDKNETVIIVEDDVVVGPVFLKFMNDALVHYRDEPRVGSISGYCYPLGAAVPETFFIRGADCWGWATWRDRWRIYNPDGRDLRQQLQQRGLGHLFNFDGAMDYLAMLDDQIAGRNNSWAVRWHASCFLRDLLVLYPGHALAKNIGQDGSGTHSTGSNQSYDVQVQSVPVKIGGVAIEENVAARNAIIDFFRNSQQTPSFLGKAKSVLRRLL